MNILYCCWNENSATDTINNMKKIADKIVCIVHSVTEYLDGSAREELEKNITEDIDIVFSYNFLPMVSEICNKRKKRYVSWVYDWPNYTVFNPEIYNECNRIYLFERDGVEMLQRYRVTNAFYFPLAVDTERLDVLLGQEIVGGHEMYDVSFVGNMYLKKEEALFTGNIPDYYSGFVDALVNAQQKIYGYNLANEIINADFTGKYLGEIGGRLDGMNVPDSFVLATQVNKLISGNERRNLLTKAAERYSVHLFTQGASDGLEKVQIHGGVDYSTKMPKVFRNSKINLNITLRSITSGIPLRVFDILGAGGFCLTNYQQGIAEHFVDGEELVMYESAEDMVDKIGYYLEHEEERIRIARNGHEAVKRFNYVNAFHEMFDMQ